MVSKSLLGCMDSLGAGGAARARGRSSVGPFSRHAVRSATLAAGHDADGVVRTGDGGWRVDRYAAGEIVRTPCD